MSAREDYWVWQLDDLEFENPVTKKLEWRRKYRATQPRIPAGQAGGGQWTDAGTTITQGPSREDVLPTDVYQAAPEAFRNVMAGAQMVTRTPSDMIDVVDAAVKNPYDAMESFGRSQWREPRRMDRVLGNTPINRFIFRAEQGTRNYELLVSNHPDKYGTWYIVPATSRFSRGRGRGKVPFWSDL